MGQALLKEDGFTLMELIMVMLFISVLAVVAIPRFSAVSETRVDLAAKKVASDMNYARTIAMTNRTTIWHRITFDAASDSYTVDSGSGQAKNPLTQTSPFTVQLDQAEYSGVTIQNNFTIKFSYPFGAPDPLVGGTVTLQGGGATRNVNVEPTTGMVSIS